MFVVCEKWVETRTDCPIDPSFSSTIAALLSHLGLGCTTVGHWGRKAFCLKLVLTSASCLQLTRTVRASGYIIFSTSTASSVLPLIYTGACHDSRLARGSVYNNHPILIFQNSTCRHFLHVPLHPLSLTHLTNNAQGQPQQIYKNELLEQQQNSKILISWRPSQYVTLDQGNYYLNLFHTILRAVGYPDKQAWNYNTYASFFLPNTIGPSAIP